MHNYFEDYNSLRKAKLHTFTSIAFIDGAEHFVTLLTRSTLYVNFIIYYDCCVCEQYVVCDLLNVSILPIIWIVMPNVSSVCRSSCFSRTNGLEYQDMSSYGLHLICLTDRIRFQLKVCCLMHSSSILGTRHARQLS